MRKTMKTTTRPILIIDGMNLFVRYFAVNETTDANGNCVGGALGFLKALNGIIETWSPSKVFIAWERGGGSARRKRIFPDYKANRAKSQVFDTLKEDTGRLHMMDEENRTYQQLLLVTLLKNTPVCQLFLKDIEADDIIAYVASQKFAKDNCLKVIVSSDKDYYQLLENDTIIVYDPATRSTFKREDVLKKYGIQARNFCVARCFVGDTSDNIPGVEGIGLKTLAKRFPILAEDRDVFLDEVIDETKKEIANGSKLKTLKAILNSQNEVKRNWDLMYLRDFNLSPHETQKIDWQIDNQERKMDKFSFIKELVRAKIAVNLDIDRLYRNLTNINL